MKHFLRFGKHLHELEEFKFHLWFKESGSSDWTFEIYPPGTENYIMLNSIDLEDIVEPASFAGKHFTISEELESHTVYIEGALRSLKTLNLSFGPYSPTSRTIPVTGNGRIMAAEEPRQPEIDYEFKGEAVWEGAIAFGETEAASFAPIGKAYNRTAAEFDIAYKTSHDGFSCSALPKRF